MLGCAPKASGPVVVIEDKVYTVTPADIAIRAGIVSGEVTEMKVVERIEKVSGKIDTPAPRHIGRVALRGFGDEIECIAFDPSNQESGSRENEQAI